MDQASWVPSIVPYGADETTYLVIDAGRKRCPETEIELSDLDAVVSELLSGRFENPMRIVAFNTLEHWSEDVSAYIADEIRNRCDIDGDRVPDHLFDFVECHRHLERPFGAAAGVARS
jgi:hypothetical protein